MASNEDFDPARDSTPVEFDPEKDSTPVAGRNIPAAPDTSDSDRKALTMSQGQTAASRALNGATFGLGDKGMSAIYAAINSDHDSRPFVDRYRDALGKSDQFVANSEAAHPKTALASGIAGALATAPLTGGQGVTRSLWSAALQGLKVGALQGAVGGFGSDRNGDNWGATAKHVAGSALMGGAVGSVLSSGGYSASKGLSNVQRMISDKLTGTKQKVINALGEDVEAESSKLRQANVEKWTSGSASKTSAGPSEASPGDLESTVSRRGKLGGEVNAAANKAEGVMARGAAKRATVGPDATPQEQEAAEFLANHGDRQVGGTHRSTPEYQNSGELTEVSPRAEIAGRGGAPATKAPLKWDGSPLAPLPGKLPGNRYAPSEEAPYGMQAMGEFRHAPPDAETPVMRPGAPARAFPAGNAEMPPPEFKPTEVYSGARDIDRHLVNKDYPEAVAAGYGGSAKDNVSKFSVLKSALAGAKNGAKDSAKSAFYPMAPLAMVAPKTATVLEGAATAYGGLKGAAKGLGDGFGKAPLNQQVQWLEKAGGAIDTPYKALQSALRNGAPQRIGEAAQELKDGDGDRNAKPTVNDPKAF